MICSKRHTTLLFLFFVPFAMSMVSAGNPFVARSSQKNTNAFIANDSNEFALVSYHDTLADSYITLIRYDFNHRVIDSLPFLKTDLTSDPYEPKTLIYTSSNLFWKGDTLLTVLRTRNKSGELKFFLVKIYQMQLVGSVEFPEISSDYFVTGRISSVHSELLIQLDFSLPRSLLYKVDAFGKPQKIFGISESVSHLEFDNKGKRILAVSNKSTYNSSEFEVALYTIDEQKLWTKSFDASDRQICLDASFYGEGVAVLMIDPQYFPGKKISKTATYLERTQFSNNYLSKVNLLKIDGVSGTVTSTLNLTDYLRSGFSEFYPQMVTGVITKSSIGNDSLLVCMKVIDELEVTANLFYQVADDRVSNFRNYEPDLNDHEIIGLKPVEMQWSSNGSVYVMGYFQGSIFGLNSTAFGCFKTNTSACLHPGCQYEGCNDPAAFNYSGDSAINEKACRKSSCGEYEKELIIRSDMRFETSDKSKGPASTIWLKVIGLKDGVKYMDEQLYGLMKTRFLNVADNVVGIGNLETRVCVPDYDQCYSLAIETTVQYAGILEMVVESDFYTISHGFFELGGSYMSDTLYIFNDVLTDNATCEKPLEMKLELNPNPVESSFIIEFPGENSEEYKLEIFNTMGGLVQTQMVKAYYRQIIYVDELLSGMYLVRISGTSDPVFTRFIKL
ncbi:MAG: T9SS type A sorting domain-containing protein [Bacteroidetes bacterium]|nr:T9SS type A sorting domain-containing protein [Bacteroidota bacterium]